MSRKSNQKKQTSALLAPPSAEDITKKRRFELIVPFISETETDKQIENILQLTPVSAPENPSLALKTSDPIPDQLVKHLFLALSADVLDISWAIVPPFASWPKNFLRAKFAPLLKQLNLYRKSTKCSTAGPIVRKMGSLLNDCTDETKEIILKCTKDFVVNIHHQIIQTKMKLLLLSDPAPKPKKKIPATVLYKQELQPLLHIIFVSINYLLLLLAFPDISLTGKKNKFGEKNKMSAAQSLMSLEILSHLYFCRVNFVDGGVLVSESIANVKREIGNENGTKELWFLMPKPKFFYESFPELAVNYTKLFTTEAEDDLLLNRAQFFLIAFEEQIGELSINFLCDELVPLLFYFIQQDNLFTNAIAHTMLREMMNLYTEEFGLKLIPKYMQIALRNYPKKTRLESLVQTMIFIVDILPARDPSYGELALYCVKKQAERVRQLQGNKLSSKLFCLSLLRLISICDVSMLLPTIEIIENLILTTKSESEQRTMCLNLRYVITRNFDAMRKNILVNWYLNLIKILQFNQEVIQSPEKDFSMSKLLDASAKL